MTTRQPIGPVSQTFFLVLLESQFNYFVLAEVTRLTDRVTVYRFVNAFSKKRRVLYGLQAILLKAQCLSSFLRNAIKFVMVKLNTNDKLAVS